MPETIGDRKIFSLLEVAGSIERTLSGRYTSSFWVKAELLKLNHYPRSGHCYPDLVEKSGDKVVAQLRAHLWKTDFERINSRFLPITKEPLKDGIAILLCARVNFDPIHGLALHILDIDPQFTLGDMMREKQETVARLMKEGLYFHNKGLSFPLLPKRIAVISVETSKGYADFLKKADGNPFGYRFFHMLFPSLLQGDKAVAGIRYQLGRILQVRNHFDVVAIIRGGGGDVGLSCYDNYLLARDIAMFPLPVLAGIGHSTNETVVQMVAYKNNITPTDVADYLIQQFHNVAAPLEKWQKSLSDQSERVVLENRMFLREQITQFNSTASGLLRDSRNALAVLATRVHFKAQHTTAMQHEALRFATKAICRLPGIKVQGHRNDLETVTRSFLSGLKEKIQINAATIDGMEGKLKLLDPKNVLKRGYSITRLNGKALMDAAEAKEGDILITGLNTGDIQSIVQSIS